MRHLRPGSCLGALGLLAALSVVLAACSSGHPSATGATATSGPTTTTTSTLATTTSTTKPPPTTTSTTKPKAPATTTTRPQATTTKPPVTSTTKPKTTTTTSKPKAPTTKARPAPPPGGPVPTGFTPISLTAISAKVRWLLGTSPCTRSICTSIVRTNNDGKRFAGLHGPPAPLTTPEPTATSPVRNSATTTSRPRQPAASGGPIPTAAPTLTTRRPSVDTLRFADPLDGYAFQAHSDGHHPLWDTHDGGTKWKKASLLGLLAFGTGDGHAFALIGSCNKGACTHVALARSPVRKDAWTPLSVPLPAVVPGPSMTVQGNDVWITASVPKTARDHQTLLVSTDAGEKFASEPSPCTAALGGTLAASTATVAWAICPNGTQATLYRTVDGGASWSQLKTPPLANSAVVAPFGRTSAIVATGTTSQLLRTTNGGRKFSVVFTTSQAKGHWTSLGYGGKSAVSGLLAVATPAGTPGRGTATSATATSATVTSATVTSATVTSATATSGKASTTSTSAPGATAPGATGRTTVPPEQLWHSKDGGAHWAGPVKIRSGAG